MEIIEEQEMHENEEDEMVMIMDGENEDGNEDNDYEGSQDINGQDIPYSDGQNVVSKVSVLFSFCDGCMNGFEIAIGLGQSEQIKNQKTRIKDIGDKEDKGLIFEVCCLYNVILFSQNIFSRHQIS